MDPSAASDRNADLYASVDGMVAALSDEECVFQRRDTGETHVMTMEVLAAMDACRRFRPLAEHVGEIEQRLPALKDKREAIATVLGSLINRGLMVSAEQLTEQLRSEDAKPRPAGAALAIRTCDRPEQLTRLLDTVATYEGHFSRGLRYVVIDDSRERDSVRRNREAVAALCDAGVAGAHLDREWRARLAAHCEDATNAPGLAGSLLGLDRGDAFTGGAASNAALLLTAGSRVLLLDDDFQIEPRQRPSAGRGLGLAEPLHTPMSFEPGLEPLAASLKSFDDDPLGPHLEACGQPASRLFGPDLGLSVDPTVWRGLSFDAGRALLRCDAIKSTAGGFWGDSPMDTTMWYYLLPGRYSRGLWSDPDRYRTLLHRPTLAHGFDQVQLTRQSNFSPLSLDNTELLPCMPPTGRGEDHAFGAWLRYLYPQSLAVHMPWMLRHERPAGGRESPHAHAFVPWVSRFAGEYALSLLEHCQAEHAAHRLAALAALYRDLSAASAERRIRVLREFLAYLRAQIVKQMQQALTSLEDPPEYWLADAREWIAENGKALTDRRPPRLQDWPEDIDEAACGAALARELERYADWLEVWPRMWQQCRGRFNELLAL